ncbi:fluoride efflux transporter CrcB [Aerolutibacter ruishenii]|uniref:Fluoride-specific ion channel FluC n=1 Tax=Aerolutibacter ruishenii TaxID=686800 RepID=A0A562LFH3_9GAMM|nr:fluoride efflux transporter CrcB [Lysobacter ruishenii]TWI06368.1 CrcB protein [Lysobacter ruishenii]
MNALGNLLLVGAGGFLGSIARYGVTLALGAPADGAFPTATFIVNAVGSAAIGFLLGMSLDGPMASPAARLFLITGVLGGFTTFSAFGVETFMLLRRGDTGLAALYVVGTVLSSLAAVWLGFRGAQG